MNRIYCNEISEQHLNKDVCLSGWVNKRRDHGGIIFIDLRDYSGIVQLVFHPENKKIFTIAESLRSEFVIEIKGKVKKRSTDAINKDIKTGSVEIIISNVVLLNKSETPPFMINDTSVNEDQRLQHRYIDLRGKELQKNLRFRSKLIKSIIDYFHDESFVNIETPILTKATPEGARDYLVPSRIHEGLFFALPQSPQLFKQTLMIGGIDRYFQIAKCFRDEDLRADRQPEFTQLDVEVSFTNENEIIQLIENLFKKIFKNIMNISDDIKFEKISYLDAMKIYGCDKPDLRNPLMIHDIKDIVKDTSFNVFSEHVNNTESRITALKIPNGNKLSRKDIDDLTNLVKQFGAKGLAYLKCEDIKNIEKGIISPIKKFLNNSIITSILNRVQAQTGDIVFFSADNKNTVNSSMAALIKHLGVKLNLLSDGWRFVWIQNYPLFEKDLSTGNPTSIHHPFTAPRNENDLDLVDVFSIESKAYDLVLNGHEIGGGSIRIHSKDIQMKVFEILKISKDEMNEKFGFFLDALSHGCPPHGGIAFGLDRLTMILLQLDTIRETIAFPKTQSASCLMTNAPSSVDNDQLKELSISITKPK